MFESLGMLPETARDAAAQVHANTEQALRVHLAHEGHPIMGDDKYGDFAANRDLARGTGLEGLRFARMFLHARRLAFDHPAGGERIVLEAPLPAECVTLLARMTDPH